MAARLTASERYRREREREAERARKRRERESERSRRQRDAERVREQKRRERESERDQKRRERDRERDRVERDRRLSAWERDKERERREEAKEQAKWSREHVARSAARAYERWCETIAGFHRIAGSPDTWRDDLRSRRARLPLLTGPFAPGEWDADSDLPPEPDLPSPPVPAEPPAFTFYSFEATPYDPAPFRGVLFLFSLLFSAVPAGLYAFLGTVERPVAVPLIFGGCMLVFLTLGWVFLRPYSHRGHGLAEADKRAEYDHEWQAARAQHAVAVAAVDQAMTDAQAEHDAAVAALQQIHAAEIARVHADNARRRAEWTTSETLRRGWFDRARHLAELEHAGRERDRVALLEAIDEGQPDALADVLGVALPLAVPDAPEGEAPWEGFDGYTVHVGVQSGAPLTALIEAVLPLGDPVPTHSVEVDARGTDVRRPKLAARERHRLTDAFVASLTLGHAVRAFRVCPSLEAVKAETVVRGVDPATGKDRMEVVLSVLVPRAALVDVDLTRVEAPAFVTALDHQWRAASSRSKKLLPSRLPADPVRSARRAGHEQIHRARFEPTGGTVGPRDYTGEITNIYVYPGVDLPWGQRVEEGGALLEVTTDHWTADFTAPRSGWMAPFAHELGDAVRAGQPLCTIDVSRAPGPQAALPEFRGAGRTLPNTSRQPPFRPGTFAHYPAGGVAPWILQAAQEDIAPGQWVHARLPDHVVHDDWLGDRTGFLSGDEDMGTRDDLEETLGVAAPGEVVLLGPGAWEPPLALKKPTHIIGAGVDRTVVHADDFDVIDNHSVGVVLEHLTLRCTDRDGSNGWASAYTGRPGSEATLRDVRIEGATEALVAVLGPGSGLILERVEIVGSRGAASLRTGLSLDPDTTVTLRDVTIRGFDVAIAADSTTVLHTERGDTTDNASGVVLDA